MDKINAAFVFGSQNGGGNGGGFRLLADTLNGNYGLTFNAGVIVNFEGFSDIVKALGGIDMYIDETVYSIHRGISKATGKAAVPYTIDPESGVPYCSYRGGSFDSDPLGCANPGTVPYIYNKGNAHLGPADALDFVRARYGLDGTDYARQRHQVQFIKAVVKEAHDKGLSDPTKALTFAKTAAKAFIFDGNGNSIGDWIFSLKNIKPAGLISIKMNGGQFVNYVGSKDSRQALNATSLQLLDAMRTDSDPQGDKVGEFIAQHPDWVAS